MNYNLISILSRDSSRLPFVLIQMEAFERAIGASVGSKRFLLSELGNARVNWGEPDKTFLFGVGALETENDSPSFNPSTIPGVVHLVAVECPPKGQFTKLEQDLIKQAARNRTEITAVDELALQAIKKVEPLVEVKVLGFIESLLEINPVSSTQAYVAICESPDDFSTPEPSIRIHFYRTPNNLKNELGLNDLYVSSFPWIGLKALATSVRVITSKPEIARIAHCLGKKLTFLNEKGEVSSEPLSPSTNLPQHRVNWRQYLGISSGHSEDTQSRKSLGSLKLALVCDQRYLAFLVAVCENLLEVHQDKIEVFLLWLGNLSQFNLKGHFSRVSFHVFQPRDIWSEEVCKRISEWPIAEQAYAAKPAILTKAISIARSPVLLSDLDIWYFKSPIGLFNVGSGKSCVVFPQWSDRFQWLRQHGFINSGMVVAKPGAEKFLDFWSRACAGSSALRLSEGLFGDQGFLDYAVMSYGDCFIYRNGDEDVASWNRQTLKFSIPEIGKVRFQVCDGVEVRSFHAAGPDSSGAFELKYLWDQLCGIFNFPPQELQQTSLWENTLHQQRLHCSFLDELLWMNERWKKRFPRVFRYQPKQLKKWMMRPVTLMLLSRATKFLDRLRGVSQKPGESFDRQWRLLHQLIFQDTGREP